MENSIKNISIAEGKWLSLLFNYSKEKFTIKPLPSHDHLHHARVWYYAKQILLALADIGEFYSLQEVEAILIAVFFHDIGMTITREKSHGLESRKLCEQFFNAYPALCPVNLDMILKMIENHDDKEYANLNSSFEKPSVAAILNIADDLDAFGNIGVYRYIEIYHFRGIKREELSLRILPNLETRFQHFEKQLQPLKDVFNKHHRRFEITRKFFVHLETDLQLKEKLSGPFYRIVQILIDFSDSSEKDVRALASNLNDPDIVVNNFFNNLLIELNTSLIN